MKTTKKIKISSLMKCFLFFINTGRFLKINVCIMFIMMMFVNNIMAYKSNSDSLKYNLIKFLISKKDLVDTPISYQAVLIIKDINSRQVYKDQKYGVFSFSTLTSDTYTHFFLLYNDQFLIVDMKNPFDVVILDVVNFLKEKEDFKKEDILLYIENITKLYIENIKSNPWN